MKLKELLKVILLGFFTLAVLIGGWIGLSWYEGQQPTSCNVAAVKLYGQVVYYPAEAAGAGTNGTVDSPVDQTAAEDLRQQIEVADADPSIKAILFQVDSPGGDPVAGEEIADALKHASKPTVAFIADEGTSAAYWAATGAQTIFASADSAIGDIGVTQSYLQQTQQDQQNGLQFISLTAGQYKDMGNPSSPLTPAERTLFQRDLNITYNNFVDQVAANRNLSTTSVATIADGSSMEGAMALKDGLIDKIGNIYDAEDYIANKIGDTVTLCANP
jgi:protease-4